MAVSLLLMILMLPVIYLECYVVLSLCEKYYKWKNRSRVKTGPMPSRGVYRT